MTKTKLVSLLLGCALSFGLGCGSQGAGGNGEAYENATTAGVPGSPIFTEPSSEEQLRDAKLYEILRSAGVNESVNPETGVKLISVPAIVCPQTQDRIFCTLITGQGDAPEPELIGARAIALQNDLFARGSLVDGESSAISAQDVRCTLDVGADVAFKCEMKTLP